MNLHTLQMLWPLLTSFTFLNPSKAGTTQPTPYPTLLYPSTAGSDRFVHPKHNRTEHELTMDLRNIFV